MEPERSGRRGYVDLDTLHAENLVKLSKEFEFDLGDENQTNWLTKAWHRLPCWPDSVSGVERLKREFICASQSNGRVALAVNLAKYNWYSWDIILGSEVVRTYKPAPRCYARACSALQLKPAECMMVAAHNSNLQAAQNAGMQTAFVRRQTEHGPNQQQDLRATGQWSL